MPRLKQFFLTFLLLELLLCYSPALAQSAIPAPTSPTYSGPQQQITQFLCTPDSGTSLYACINQLYRFAIALACTVGVFFLVIAGYIYMSASGNQESVDKAKSILESTIVSLVILFGGFLLLKTLNPDLVSFQQIQLPVGSGGLAGPPAGGGGTGTTGTTGGGQAGAGGTATGSGPHGTAGSGVCAPITDSNNPVSVANLQNSCLAPNATLFSEISNEETGGGQSIPSSSDKCADGNPVSFGYFQINITQVSIGSLPCPSAFTKPYTASDKSCIVKTDAASQALYQQCKTAALDPNQNIQAACAMSNNGTNLTPWNGSCFAKWVSN